jgi:hypothetical protein
MVYRRHKQLRRLNGVNIGIRHADVAETSNDSHEIDPWAGPQGIPSLLRMVSPSDSPLFAASARSRVMAINPSEVFVSQFTTEK